MGKEKPFFEALLKLIKVTLPHKTDNFVPHSSKTMRKNRNVKKVPFYSF